MKKKKKKISDFQINKISNHLKKTLDSDIIVEKEITIDDLYSLAKKKKRLTSYKNLFNYTIFKNKDFGLTMIIEMLFNKIDKDKMYINDKMMETIENLEKIFIELNKIEIERYTENENYIIVYKITKDIIPENLINC